jgi:Subtilase family
MCDFLAGSVIVGAPLDEPIACAFTDALSSFHGTMGLWPHGDYGWAFDWWQEVDMDARLQGVKHRARASERVHTAGGVADPHRALELDKFECTPGDEVHTINQINGCYRDFVLEAGRRGIDVSGAAEFYVQLEQELGFAGLGGNHTGYLTDLGLPATPASGGSAVEVAVVDSGVSPTFSPKTQHDIDFGGTGVSTDTQGHGTAVAEIIRSVCPEADIVSARVTDDKDRIAEFDALAALSDHRVAAASLVNLSITFGFQDGECQSCGRQSRASRSSVFERMLASLAADLVVCAAGNFVPGQATPGLKVQDELAFPARFPNVVAVGAVDSAGVPSDLTREGPDTAGKQHQWLVFAPGGRRIAPTERIGADLAGKDLRGTSFAAAYVTGILAQLVSQGSTPLAARSTLVRNCHHFANHNGHKHGKGRVVMAAGTI